MTGNYVQENNMIVFVWGTATPPSDMAEIVASIKKLVGSNGQVKVENATMLVKSGHDNSSFDVLISGTDQSPFAHTNDLLAEMLRILKPTGHLAIKESKGERSADKLKSVLTLAGFTKIMQVENKSDNVIEMTCQKPNFEVGKSSKLPLSFSKKSTNPDVVKVWTLSLDDMNDDDVDLIDSDALLDANDLKRPDLTAIKTDCGTSKGGKRKACKGCTCGLKEELETGVQAPVQEKSACGSCNLGDAFRCASCPYLGMPPFKPGEQVTLSSRQLNPDVQT